MPAIPSLRSRAHARQGGRCCYCLLPTWLSDQVAFATHYGITRRQARRLQCTAEHLVARAEGGTDSQENIAAACLRCNQGRHARKRVLDPLAFALHVERRLAAGGWHPGKVVRRCAARVKAPSRPRARGR